MKPILAALMMLLSTAAYGQLVKCVSKDGKVEYARDCPAGTTEQKTNIRSNPGGAGAGAPPPAARSLAERDADFKKRQIERQEAAEKSAKAEADERARREGCDNARAYLKQLEEGHRIARTDPKTGERIFMEDAERAKETGRAQAMVAERCK